MQPTKVVLAVVVVSFVSTRTKNNCNVKEDTEIRDASEDDVTFLSDNPKEQFKRSRLEAIRVQTKKEVKLTGIMKDVAFHLIFVFLGDCLLWEQEQLSLRNDYNAESI